jgi:pyroglutamyl-peptidase
MPRILITGFEPFDGRSANASWAAASALTAELGDPDVMALELPVVWDKPKGLLINAVQECSPELILSMGEGKPGAFQLESLARNARKLRLDNNDNFPVSALIEPAGVTEVSSSVNLDNVCKLLAEKAIPAKISTDAGGFLCEETFYSLEVFCMGLPTVTAVMFIHLPPLGTELTFKNRVQACDSDLLLEFGLDLFAIVTALHEMNLLLSEKVS